MKKICIAGKNNIAVEITKYLKKKDDIEILAIPNSADNGIDGWQKSFYKFCLENSIPIISLEEAHKIENLIFLSLEFDKIVKPYEFLSDKLFNIHFSLLPKYKGMYTSALPILNNEKETGVTLHKIDTGIDTGEIIAQRKIKIEFDDTSRDLYLKYISNGIELIKENIYNILNNTVVTYPQNNLESSYFSKKSIDYKNLKININQTALNIHNQIRAFNFREYQLPKVHDKKIISTLTTNQKSLKKPGTILFETDNEILMSTIDYNIILYKDRTDELFKACCTGDIILVQEICKNKEYLKVRNDKGWDPLIVAVYNNNIEVVKHLISLGANIYTENYNGTNLIMYAKDCYLNTKDSTLLELFIRLGLDIYKKDFKNKNVLDYCSDELKERIIKYETNQKINGGGYNYNNLICLGDKITLRTVEEKDASFILQLRNKEELKKYISDTNISLEQQMEWIRNYKTREENGQEFYFIVEDKNKIPCGTVRIYEVEENRCTWGSFILDKSRPDGASFETLLLSINFIKFNLGIKNIYLDVRKENLKAIHIYEKFGFKRIQEDSLNYYYVLEE